MKRKFVTVLFELVPLFAGFFVLTSKPAPLRFDEYLGRYICFILLFGLWTLFRDLLPLVFPKDTSKNLHTAVKLISVGILAFMLIVAIFLFQRRFNNPLYEIALTLLGIDAFAIRFRETNRYILFWIFGALYYTGVSFISFQMVVLSFQWQTIIFSCAVASLPLAVQTAELFSNSTDESPLLMKRLCVLSLATGPIAVAFLVFLDELPRPYLTPFVLIPFIATMKFEKRQAIFWRASLVGLLFIVNLGLLAILT